jgi:hypothetical protein
MGSSVAAELHSGSASAAERRAVRVPSMSENLQLSPPAWTLLDMLQQQLGVAIEVFDLSLRPLGPGNGLDRAGSAPEAITAEIHKSLKTGEIRIDRSTGAPVGIFPIRAARQIAGCIVVVASPARGVGAHREPDVEVDSAGHLARAAIESDLTLTNQLTDARHRARRVHAILRFLTQLGGTATGDIMNAVVQAATVWFDVDCRIYERNPDGAYTLSAVLPGAEGRSAGARIESQRADKLIASRRFSSGGDLDDLGLGGRHQEVVVMPVGRAASPEWLLILAGAIDHEVELTFAAIARVLAGELVARDAARLQRWQSLLADLMRAPGAAPERVMLSMLEGLAGELSLSMARLTLNSDGEERVLAALGPSQAPVDAAAVAGTQSFTVGIGPDATLTLLLAPGVDARLAALQTSSWLTAVQPWLPNAIAQMSMREALFDVPQVDESPFECRIQEEIERAKRFNLGLGLVLIGPVDTRGSDLDTLLSSIRAELRASDLMGRLRNGLVAVLLVHAEPIGTESVINRLRRRLAGPGDRSSARQTQVGRAVFSPDTSSADALIALALRQAQAFESRH